MREVEDYAIVFPCPRCAGQALVQGRGIDAVVYAIRRRGRYSFQICGALRVLSRKGIRGIKTRSDEVSAGVGGSQGGGVGEVA